MEQAFPHDFYTQIRQLLPAQRTVNQKGDVRQTLSSGVGQLTRDQEALSVLLIQSAAAMMQNFELPGLSLASLLQSPEANTLNLNVLRRINPDINKVTVPLACTADRDSTGILGRSPHEV